MEVHGNVGGATECEHDRADAPALSVEQRTKGLPSTAEEISGQVEAFLRSMRSEVRFLFGEAYMVPMPTADDALAFMCERFEESFSDVGQLEEFMDATQARLDRSFETELLAWLKKQPGEADDPAKSL